MSKDLPLFARLGALLRSSSMAVLFVLLAIAAVAQPQKDIEQLFAPLRGLNLDFSRNPSTGRPVDL